MARQPDATYEVENNKEKNRTSGKNDRKTCKKAFIAGKNTRNGED